MQYRQSLVWIQFKILLIIQQFWEGEHWRQASKDPKMDKKEKRREKDHEEKKLCSSAIVQKQHAKINYVNNHQVSEHYQYYYLF